MTHPVYCVVSNFGDGRVQCLTGPTVTRTHELTLAQAVGQDSTLAELADLPPGWMAERSGPGAPWTRMPI